MIDIAMKLRFLGALGMLAVAALSVAQSRGSFLKPATLTGLTTRQVGANNYRIEVGSNPTMSLGGRNYQILDVFGFYKLDNNDDYSAAGRDQFGWRWASNTAGIGGVFGWRTEPRNGLQAGESITLCFDCENGCPECIGYHVRVRDIQSCQDSTLYVEYCPVPEPVTALGMLAAVPFLRRRRK